MSGITVDLPTILDVINNVYDDFHEIRFNIHGQSFIEDMQQEIVKDFKNLDELYKWTLEQKEKI